MMPFVSRRFTINALYWHDVALGRGALLNVLTGGKAVDLNLHHEFGGCLCTNRLRVCKKQRHLHPS